MVSYLSSCLSCFRPSSHSRVTAPINSDSGQNSTREIPTISLMRDPSSGNLPPFNLTDFEETSLMGEAVPSLKWTKARVATNAVALLALAASGTTLGVQYGGVIKKDVRLITASYLILGTALRAFIEANFSEQWRENVQSVTSKWYFEILEGLWQAFLNVSNITGQAAILNAIMVFGSFAFAGDFLFPFRTEEKDNPNESLVEGNLVLTSVNPIVGPSYDNTKGQIILKTALTAVGILLTGASYAKNTGLNAFYRSLGYFLSFQGIGFFGAKIGSKWWEVTENLDAHHQPIPNSQDIDEPTDEAPYLSLKTRITRLAPKIATNVGPEGLALVYWLNNAYLYIPAGLIYGFMQYLAQRKFQVLTYDVYKKQINSNMDMTPLGKKIKTSLKVEMAASVAFLALFLGWFTYGAEQSQPKDRWGIIVLMISYILTGLCAAPVEKYFKPEKNRKPEQNGEPEQTGKLARVINHLRYVFYYHPYSIALAYLSLRQITFINDESLQLDSLPKYICGLVSGGLFGMNFALNRMRNISLSRFPIISPAVARMIFAKTVIDRFEGVFGM